MEKELFLKKYEEVYKDLYRYAYFSLGHAQDAEDAVSETVMDAYASRDKLKDVNAFRGWIFIILYRKCKAKRKEYATKKVVSLDEKRGDDGKTFSEILSNDEIDVSDKEELKEMFFSMTSEERRIVGLHVICGYTSKEISKILGIRESTIRSKEYRAFLKLRKEWMD